MGSQRRMVGILAGLAHTLHSPCTARRKLGVAELKQVRGADGAGTRHRGSAAVFHDVLSGFGLQQAQAVEDHDQARAHVGEHGHPHGGAAQDGQHQEDRLDTQGQHDVLPQHRARAP